MELLAEQPALLEYSKICINFIQNIESYVYIFFWNDIAFKIN